MPREVEDHHPDVYPAARNPPCPQKLHYYDERRHPRHFAGRFDRGDMGASYPYESWPASGRSYCSRPQFEYGPGSPFFRDAYGRAGADVHHPYRNDYRRRDEDERDFRSPNGTRDDSVEHEHGERKRRHHKSSKHHHRRSRHHRRHKRSKHSEMPSDDEQSNDLPSLTLGAEISRGRWHSAGSVTKISAPGSDISEDSSHSQSLDEPSDNVGASGMISPVASTVPVVYSSYDIENDEGEGEVTEPTTSVAEKPESSANVVGKQDSSGDSDDGSSSDAESSKNSRSSSSSSESGSPNAKKLHPVTKVRSSYATALAAKLRQNRWALDERLCRRPDTSSARLQPSDESPSVIDKSAMNTETSRLCSDNNFVIDNGLNVERVVTTNSQLEKSSTCSVVSCSAPLWVNSSTCVSVSRSAKHRESHSSVSLNWYVAEIVYFRLYLYPLISMCFLFRINMQLTPLISSVFCTLVAC